MNSTEIQAAIKELVLSLDFNAPYGVICDGDVDSKGKKFLIVTFGRSRTLDATVKIYNRGFMILRTSRDGSTVYKNFEDLKAAIETL